MAVRTYSSGTGGLLPPRSVSERCELAGSLDLLHWLLFVSEVLQTTPVEWVGQVKVQTMGLLEGCVRVMAVGEGGTSDLITLVHRTCLLVAAERDSQCIVKVGLCVGVYSVHHEL